jgi:hypothetical protein
MIKLGCAWDSQAEECCDVSLQQVYIFLEACGGSWDEYIINVGEHEVVQGSRHLVDVDQKQNRWGRTSLRYSCNDLAKDLHLAIKGQLQKAFWEESKDPGDETQGKAELSKNCKEPVAGPMIKCTFDVNED